MKWLLVLSVLFSLSFGQSMAANDAFHERQVSELKKDIQSLREENVKIYGLFSELATIGVDVGKALATLEREIKINRHYTNCFVVGASFLVMKLDASTTETKLKGMLLEVTKSCFKHASETYPMPDYSGEKE